MKTHDINMNTALLGSVFLSAISLFLLFALLLLSPFAQAMNVNAGCII